MSRDAQIAEVVAFFRNAFSLIFALALAEAFKQFVIDRARTPMGPVIDWEKLIPLLAFVLLIFPFYQGTIRYFVFTYGDAKALLQQSYSVPVMFDGVMFVLEAALFFIMSRALAPAHWVTYYGSVVTLLWVDSLWGLGAAWFHNTPIEWWIYLNIGFGAIVLILLIMHGRLKAPTATILGAVAVLLRTVLDYYTTWNFYFP
jgi:hypothetical protein